MQNSLLALGMVAILLVLIAGFVSYQQAIRLVDSGSRLAASHKLISALDLADTEIREIESYQRGFVIGTVEMLDKYTAAVSKVEKQIQTIDSLGRGNSGYRNLLEQLLVDTGLQIEFSRNLIEARSSNRINEALEAIEEGRGNRYVQKMRGTIQSLRDQEKSVLVKRTEAINELSAGMTVTVALLGVLALGFLLMLLIASNLYVTERRRIENLTSAQHEISQCLAESGDLTLSIARIVQITCNRLGWDAGGFWEVVPGNSLRCLVFCHRPGTTLEPLANETPGRIVGKENTLLGQVWQEGQPVWVPDLALDERFQRKELLDKHGLQSAFFVPIVAAGTTRGVMEFFCRSPRIADESILETFNSIGNQLGQFMQRKGSEWELQVNQARLNAILGNMAEAVVVADRGGTIIQHNPAAVDMLGEDLLSKPVQDWDERQVYRPGDDGSPAEELPLMRAVREESVDEEELLISSQIHPRGIWVSATARPVRDGQGDLLGGLMVLRDISERKEAERRVSEFYSMVSHELRTPLTSIRASLGLMQGGVAGDLPDTALELIDIGREECDRLIRLINNILDIRKIEAGKFELNRNEVSPGDLVRASMEAMKAFAEENLVVLIEGEHVDSTIVADLDRVIQVLTNLISNAIKFSPRGGEVTISSVLVSDNWIRFMVTDRGPGIASDQLRKLFQKFQQLDQSDTRKMGGTGLGLAICKAIVEEHGGRIGVESEPEKGSTFFFEIPCEPEDDDST